MATIEKKKKKPENNECWQRNWNLRECKMIQPLVENSIIVTQKIKVFLGFIHKRTESRASKRYVNIRVHSRTIHNS